MKITAAHREFRKEQNPAPVRCSELKVQCSRLAGFKEKKFKHRSSWMKIFPGCAFIILFVGAASAEILLTDSFDYSNGPLITVSDGKWTNHSGAVGELNVDSERAFLKAADTEDVSAILAGQPYDSDGATNIFYAGFSVRFTSLPSASGTYFAHFKTVSGSTFRARIWALTDGAAQGKFRIGISSTSSTSVAAVFPEDLNLNTDYTVVTRLVNSNSASKLWINPSAESDSSVSTSDGVSHIDVAAYAFRQATGEGNLSVDDLRVGTSFTDVITNAPVLLAPNILEFPTNESVIEDTTAIFSVVANGAMPLSYQWQWNGTNLLNATNATLTIPSAQFMNAGFYDVIVSNVIDSIASVPVALNIFSKSPPTFSLLTYNLHGNGAENWSTNTFHVRAIGRQAKFLQPDILTFQEIPVTNNGTAQMTNFVSAFLPGYNLATNSATDGFIRSVILSRYPILSSKSWLHNSDLSPYGYTKSRFTRDLFEAVISVPGFPQPLHVFTVHLKSGQDSDSASKRAAETGAISNFFAIVYPTNNSFQPYLVTGDMNEDLMRPPASAPQSIQRLVSAPTGLHLTTPFNPISGGELTFSIQSGDGLTRRYDYILPCGLLFSNVTSSEIFRTDLLNPISPDISSNDDSVASDHLPVLMSFANPYNKSFHVFVAENSGKVRLTWTTVPGQSYRIETSTNMTSWRTFLDNLLATNSILSVETIANQDVQFFRIHRLP
jgi:endonuclease/exonuclease/phosphatase family metal-dependent hydrolase